MPYVIKDFKEKCRRIYTMKLKPFGWVNPPVEVEYGTFYIDAVHDPQPSVCMRVKGTEHVWANFVDNINFESKGNYEEYFTKVLEQFRLDMLAWLHTPRFQNLEWVKAYWKMFGGRFYDFSDEEQRKFDSISRGKGSSLQDK